MNTYLIVGAQRIQSWMSRTPRLRFVRGASAAMEAHTSAPRISHWIEQNSILASVEQTAPEISGIVVLNIPDSSNAAQVAGKLLAHLGSELPAIELEAAWVEADSYLGALNRTYEAMDPFVGRMSRLPEPFSLPSSATCDECGLESATIRTRVVDKVESVGRDCAVRLENQRPLDGDRQPRDFSDLALLVPEGLHSAGGKASRNHLATIAADGNNVGALFKQIVRSADAKLQQDVARKLDEATKFAVDYATEEAKSNDDAGRSAVICHYVGGDDILVSVPAPLAWQFAANLGAGFERHFQAAFDLDSEEPLARSLRKVSLGIGIAFANSSHPFSETLLWAKACEKQAKTRSMGEASAVSWVDLTRESSLPEERWMSIVEVERGMTSNGGRESLMYLAASARSALDVRVRAARAVSGGKQMSEIERWFKRTGTKFPPNLSLQDVDDLLCRARWWPEWKA